MYVLPAHKISCILHVFLEFCISFKMKRIFFPPPKQKIGFIAALFFYSHSFYLRYLPSIKPLFLSIKAVPTLQKLHYPNILISWNGQWLPSSCHHTATVLLVWPSFSCSLTLWCSKFGCYSCCCCFLWLLVSFWEMRV